MASVEITKVKDGITLSIDAMITRGKSVSSFLNRATYPVYQQLQIQRWETENASENESWNPVKPDYATIKRKRYAGFPGGGQKLMVATSKLAFAAQGLAGALKIVTESSMTVGIDQGFIPYAKYPGADRPYMSFSDDSISKMTDPLVQYIMNGTGL